MISRIHERLNPNRTPGMPWQSPRIPDSISYIQDEGTITESIQGNKVSVTVSLRRAWAVMMGDEGDTQEFRQTFKHLHAIWRTVDATAKILALIGICYLAFRILPAFLPGGAAYNLFEGNQ